MDQTYLICIKGAGWLSRAFIFVPLCMMLKIKETFCAFCTEEHVSLSEFHEFYILTKIYVEIRLCFVYNVFVAVLLHPM